MKVPFEVGGHYRNRNGVYEVLSLEGEHMTILYESGRVQTVSIAMQARIWDNIQIDEAPPQPKPGRVGADDEGLDSWPIKELVQEVLRPFKAPIRPTLLTRCVWSSRIGQSDLHVTTNLSGISAARENTAS